MSKIIINILVGDVFGVRLSISLPLLENVYFLFTLSSILLPGVNPSIVDLDVFLNGHNIE